MSNIANFVLPAKVALPVFPMMQVGGWPAAAVLSNHLKGSFLLVSNMENIFCCVVADPPSACKVVDDDEEEATMVWLPEASTRSFFECIAVLLLLVIDAASFPVHQGQV